MLFRSLLLFFALALLLVPACSFRSGYDVEDQLVLAHDLQVRVTLRYPNQLGAEPGRISSVRASRDTGLRIDDPSASGQSISFDIRPTRLGTHHLTVEYKDKFNHEHKQVFSVEVVEVGHTELSVSCDTNQDDESYWVPPGAKIPYRGRAYDDENGSLLIGDWDVVRDADGFEPVKGEDNVRLAPDEPGTYTWTLSGSDERKIKFVVYDLSLLSPRMSKSTQTKDESEVLVEIETHLDGLPSGAAFCSLPERLRAHVETTAGECSPQAGGLDLVGGLTVELEEGTGSFTLAGDGPCTVETTLSYGGREELELTVLPEEPTFEEGEGIALGTTPVELTPLLDDDDPVAWSPLAEGCKEYALWPSEDCSSEYEIQPISGESCVDDMVWRREFWSARARPTLALGAGLWAELLLGLEITRGSEAVDGLAMPPSRLELDYDEEAVSLLDLGCSEEESVFRVTVAESGTYEIGTDAENAIDPWAFDLTVEDIARTNLVEVGQRAIDGDAIDEASDVDLERVKSDEDGSLRHFFPGTSGTFHLNYSNEAGGLLFGVGPVSVTSSEPAAEALVEATSVPDEIRIFSGYSANLVEVRSTIAPGIHRIHVEDASGIAAIEGGDDATIAPNEEHCVSLYPLAEDGLHIQGKVPVRPRLSGAKRTLLVSRTTESSVCFRPITSGAIELTWTWGAAEKKATWTVEDP